VSELCISKSFLIFVLSPRFFSIFCQCLKTIQDVTWSKPNVFVTHMTGQAPLGMFDRQLGSQVPFGVRPASELFCAKYDTQQQPSQQGPAFCIPRTWNTGSLTVVQAAYEAPATGVTPFECFIRSLDSNSTHNGAQKPPRHSKVSDRRSLDKKQIGQPADQFKLVHDMSGAFGHDNCHSRVVQSGTFSRVSDPKINPNAGWGEGGGGRIKLD
jgi:hypothetical protein